MNIICATGNLHKKEEFQQLFPEHEISIPKDLHIAFDVEETGSSFIENAIIKATYFYNKTGKPVIADDSGLCVDALNGAPGIYSARYGNDILAPNASFKDRYTLLLEAMRETVDRRARFVCSLVYYYGTDRYFSIQETVEGVISDAPMGQNGFGYDPVFFIPSIGKTMAQLSETQKNEISHRGKAVRGLRKILETL